MNWLKQWILRQMFVRHHLQDEMDEFLDLQRPKIFALAQKDILETMADDLDKRAEVIAQKKLAELLTNIDDQKIVTANRAGNILIGGELADDSTLNNLKAEAEFIVHSELWKILYESPKKLAHRAMFVDDGKIENQLLKGRAMLFLLDTQQKILTTFQTLSTVGFK